MNLTFEGSKNYVASEELMRFCKIAIALQSPCSSRASPVPQNHALAEAISQALGKKLIIWNIKSTTKAQDGLYVYDVVQRLYDSQFGNEGVDDIGKYVKLGKLGEAFHSDEQVILLIDEIDKADLEFPNDLLRELIKWNFYIPETKETVKAKAPHRDYHLQCGENAPDAFLRRCIFHYTFPDAEQMGGNHQVHFDHVEENVLKQVSTAFIGLNGQRIISRKSPVPLRSSTGFAHWSLAACLHPKSRKPSPSQAFS